MGTPAEACPEPSDGHVGTRAVELGLITEMQLRDVLARMSAAPAAERPANLSEALVKYGLLTQRQLEALNTDTAAIRKKLGKYRIVRVLGRGGMGVVYEAIDSDLGRTVALKMLMTTQASDPKEAAIDEERFVREARLTANLPKHPGIVGVYESGMIEGRRYIAMEYIDGKVFSDWIAKTTASLKTPISILRDAALAVDHAHRHGVIHRDMKPANVLVDTKGRPHVTDFGLARQVRQDAALTLTGGGKVMGTPTYISPEQASGSKHVDRRTDVWSLGVMLYEVLTGRAPFRGETPIDLMMKVVKNPVPPPSSVRGGGLRPIDKAIENICMKALAKEPSQRYPSAAAFAEDLSKWLRGESVVIQAPVAAARPPWAWIAGVGGAAAAVILAVVLLSGPSGAEKAAAERKARAEALVVQGQRLLAQGKPADALVAFGQATELDEDNRAAATGRREAERKIAASRAGSEERRPEPPPTAPPPPAKAPSGPTPESLVRAASEFTKANPRDVEGQIRMWQQARTAGAGTPFAEQAARELEAALARRRKAVENELSELDHTVDALREAESFGAARDILGQASRRHEDAEWVAAVQDRQEALRKSVMAAYAPLKEKALDAKRRDDKGAVEGLRAHLVKWRWPELSSDLDDALGKVAAVPAPPPDEPGPATTLPEVASLQGHGSGVSAAAFSPDGKLLVTTSFDKTVRLWDVPSHAEKAKLVESGAWAPSAAISPDGKWIAAGFVDGSIRLWDTAKLQSRPLTGHTLQAISLSFSPDSKLLASASTDGTVRFWDPATASHKSTLEGHPKGAMAVAWSPDGKLLAVGCAERLVKIWEIPAGRERRSFTDGTEGPTYGVAFLPGGKALAGSGQDGKIYIWDLDSGRRRSIGGHAKDVRGLVCSPDGSWLASASLDGTLRVWDAASGELRAIFKDPNGFFGATLSKKGDVLVGCGGSWNVRMWETGPLRGPKGDSK